MAADPHHTFLASHDRLAFGRGQSDLVSGDALAGRSDLLLVGRIRKIDVQHLGRSETFKDLVPEASPPIVEDILHSTSAADRQRRTLDKSAESMRG